MTTGNHTVRDIFCVKCATVLGWKYVRNDISTFHRIIHLISFFRTVPTNNRSNTKRANTYSSEIFSSMSSSLKCLGSPINLATTLLQENSAHDYNDPTAHHVIIC